MAEGIRLKGTVGTDGRILLSPVGERSKAAGEGPFAHLVLMAEGEKSLREERRLKAILKEKGAEPGSDMEKILRVQYDRRPAQPAPEAPPGSDLERILRTVRGV